jgi:hypothetical protein
VLCPRSKRQWSVNAVELEQQRHSGWVNGGVLCLYVCMYCTYTHTVCLRQVTPKLSNRGCLRLQVFRNGTPATTSTIHQPTQHRSHELIALAAAIHVACLTLDALNLNRDNGASWVWSQNPLPKRAKPYPRGLLEQRLYRPRLYRRPRRECCASKPSFWSRPASL